MGGLFVYILKVSVCIVMFYIYYRLLVSRTTFHVLNRFVILTLMASSLLLPLAHITLNDDIRHAVTATVSIDRLEMLAQIESGDRSFLHLTAVHWLMLVYLAGVVVFAVRMIMSCLHVRRVLNTAGQVLEDNGVRIYITDDVISPFSWFRNIVISRSDYYDNGNAIIEHERCHAVRMHSADILLCNILTVVQWFNPAIWLLKSELQDVHEYEADESVIRAGVNAVEYQLLLVRKAVGDQMFAIANNLSKDSLKKRITMMKMKKTSRWECMKLTVVFPLAAFAVVVFANPKVNEVEKRVMSDTDRLLETVAGRIPVSAGNSAAAENALQSLEQPVQSVADTVRNADDSKAFDICSQMPSFPGGMSEMMNYIAKNVKYPAEAVAANTEGRVVLSFVVEKDGTISNINVVRSVSPELDSEAVRVVGTMPKWEPGKNEKGEVVRVKFTIPVSFKLSGGNTENLSKEKELERKNTGEVAGYDSGKINFLTDNVLVIIDGKKLIDTNYKNINEISPSVIKSITVLKDEEAVKKYGEDGKNGVIIINMKS